MLQLCSVCCDCVRSVCCYGTATHPVKVINSVQYVATPFSMLRLSPLSMLRLSRNKKNKKFKTLKIQIYGKSIRIS